MNETMENTKAWNLGIEILRNLDVNDGYIQLRDGVYIQTSTDAIADVESNVIDPERVKAQFPGHRYWIVCAPNLPIGIDGIEDFAEFLDWHDITADEVEL